ncbi:PREDICTED: DNA dC-_dU-editing enzyme APOBEC-3H [Chinchilla lanigera]|uniref:DNA dC->dU-editing enzyme APOBEC-3H n=1 Tax=Chinchilla lanigera TaxID=34839 RepID=UPI000698EE88|nr:PREDICTED: DNA dC->dU-editing enzyme APOBEC-3H [Chinchilla lanigera]
MPLGEETFRVQFNNAHKVPKPYRRRVTYLCYQLHEANGHLLTKGCLRTKRLPVTSSWWPSSCLSLLGAEITGMHHRAQLVQTSLDSPQKGHHAESRFIKRISSMDLDRSRSYQITCFLTWSPCPSCAQELASFKRAHPHLRFQIFVSRLYFHWKRSYQAGLHQLCTSQVPIIVMGHPEFAYCWHNFVDHQPGPFEPPWDKLEYYSNCIKRRLQKILRSWGADDFTDNFRNLRLGPTSPPVA